MRHFEFSDAVEFNLEWLAGITRKMVPTSCVAGWVVVGIPNASRWLLGL